jgi:hypothetical protein
VDKGRETDGKRRYLALPALVAFSIDIAVTLAGQTKE